MATSPAPADGTFKKSSFILVGMPVSAALSPFLGLMVLPVDVAWGCLIAYHTKVGVDQVTKDYLPGYLQFIPWLMAGVCFVGIQTMTYNAMMNGAPTFSQTLYNVATRSAERIEPGSVGKSLL